MVDSYLWLNTPIQMISCTDTDGKITPLRFRFRDRDESIVTVTIDRIISTDQGNNKIGPTFECAATVWGAEKRFNLHYSLYSGKWVMKRIGI